MKGDIWMERVLRVVSIFAVLFSLAPVLADLGSGAGAGRVPAVAFAAGAGNNEERAAPAAEPISDPLEKLNRGIFKLNDRLYFWVMKPTATVYSWYFPEGFRICVRNAFTNFMFPVRFINNVLQGKFQYAGTEAGRFAVNSTLGFAGMWDIAARDFGLAVRDEDFGQTLGAWGAGSGFYIVLPVFGPSNVRDTVGLGVDSVMNPVFWLASTPVSAGVKAGKTVNSMSLRIGEYEDFKKSALDPYVSMREAYTQYRAEEMAK